MSKLFAGLRLRLAPERWKDRKISECVAVLPVLRAQIREAAQQVEHAIGELCMNFQGIAERSREAVGKAGEMVGTGCEENSASMGQSIETSRATISGLLERIERAGQVSAMAISHMTEMEQTVRGMEGLLAEVAKISFTNKLVALNAKIEAVHVGALGRGFEVVAEEISRQAERTTELTEGIAQRIQQMRDRMLSAAGHLNEFAAEDRAQNERSRRNAEDVLQVLLSIHQRACDSVALLSADSGRLTSQIDQAVVGLQFQDRFSQRLTHVAEALEKVERTFGWPGQPFLAMPDHTPHPGRSLMEDVEAAHTMQDEREVMARLRHAAAPVAATEGGDVELF